MFFTLAQRHISPMVSLLCAEYVQECVKAAAVKIDAKYYAVHFAGNTWGACFQDNMEDIIAKLPKYPLT
jgi:hypothetical protein